MDLRATSVEKKRNPAIICCRAFSMLLIVLCHIVDYYTFIPGHGFLSQILNVGVFSFLAISGYLYGEKTIQDFKVWFRKRYVTVMLPASVLIVFILIVEFCAGTRNSVFSTVVYLLNLQGLGFLYPRFYGWFSEIEVLGPLWFITVIMLCYCMVPALQKIRDSFSARRHSTLCVVGIAVGCFVFTMLTNVNTIYFLTFALGYYLSAQKRLQPVRISGFALLSVLMLGTQILRLILRAVCDGTPLYQNYVSISHMTLGIWILCFFFVCSQVLPNFTTRLAGHKAMIAVSDISFYVYLTHCSFCRGSLNIYRLTDSLLLATLVFLLATAVASLILRKIVNYVQRALRA